MYKIYSDMVLYNFLLLMLFIGIISNKIGIVAYALILSLIVVIFFFKIKKSQITLNSLSFMLFGFFTLYISYIYQIFQYEHNNLYYVQFFASQIFFILLFSLIRKDINLRFNESKNIVALEDWRYSLHESSIYNRAIDKRFRKVIYMMSKYSLNKDLSIKHYFCSIDLHLIKVLKKNVQK
jgi:signal transduction histidine kinase